MATNKLTPFAYAVGANVISYERWIALTTTLANGFTSGIASSEQFNRLLAQGAAAGYVIGQIIVDGLNVDADPLDPASLVSNFKAALDFLPLAGGTMSGTINFSALSGTASRALIKGTMADDDGFRIQISGTATDAGFAEIATAGDGNEPVYVRQYSGDFSTLVRSLALLDASGNSLFPGQVTAQGNFVGNLTGKATQAGTADSAIKANQDRNGQVIDETYSPILVGELKWYAGRTVPNGYLLCDGRAVSRTTYAALFAAIGTIYGSGDGGTTFNLPNGNGRTLQGTNTVSQVGTYKAAGLPGISHSHTGTTSTTGNHSHTKGSMEITGSFGYHSWAESRQGAFYDVGGQHRSGTNNDSGSGGSRTAFAASRSWTGTTSTDGAHTHTFTTGANTGVNAIYGASATVQPPAMVGMLIIKY